MVTKNGKVWLLLTPANPLSLPSPPHADQLGPGPLCHRSSLPFPFHRRVGVIEPAPTSGDAHAPHWMLDVVDDDDDVPICVQFNPRVTSASPLQPMGARGVSMNAESFVRNK